MKIYLIKILWKIARRIPEFSFQGLRNINFVGYIMRRRVLALFPKSNIAPTVVIASGVNFPLNIKITLKHCCVIKKNVKVGMARGIGGESEFSVGQNSLIMGNVNFDCSDSIFIGKNCHIGRNSKFYTHKHDCSMREIPVLKAPVSADPIRVGDDVMIFDEVVVLGGVEIQDGAVIGIRSVVTRDVGKYKICAGIPAREIGDRI